MDIDVESCNPAPRAQRGFTLVELSLVLALAALAYLAITGLFGVGLQQTRATSFADSVLDLQQRIRDYYHYQPGYDNPRLSSAFAVANNLAPPLLVTGNSLQYQGTAIALSPLGPSPARQWSLSVSLPQAVCPQAISLLADRFTAVTVNGQAVVAPGLAYTPSTAASACAGSSQPAVTLTSQ